MTFNLACVGENDVENGLFFIPKSHFDLNFNSLNYQSIYLKL